MMMLKKLEQEKVMRIENIWKRDDKEKNDGSTTEEVEDEDGTEKGRKNDAHQRFDEKSRAPEIIITKVS